MRDMKKSYTAIAALLVAGALAGPAFAQEITFAEVDADMSGTLSFAEVTAKHGEVTQDQFDLADANGDNMLDADEYTALLALLPGTTAPGTIQQDPPPPAN
jgi:hypothetical protein